MDASADASLERHLLDDVEKSFRALKAQAERALAQVDDAAFFAQLDADANSLAVLVQHLAGNLRSRWTDFLTTDGEKPDRHRDDEFVIAPGTTRVGLMGKWEEGWDLALAGVRALTPADLMRTVHLRGKGMTVFQALSRQLVHCAGHAAQIVLLAKHYAGPGWTTLSIPRGKSEEYTARMRALNEGTVGSNSRY